MRKNIIFFVIIFIVVAVLIVFGLLFKDNFLAGSEKSSSNICEALEGEIGRLIDQMNSCNIDSDCIITEFGCPFGCYTLLHKDADEPRLQRKVANYKSTCSRCMYDCDVFPKQEEIKCVSNKCIDIRYQK